MKPITKTAIQQAKIRLQGQALKSLVIMKAESTEANKPTSGIQEPGNNIVPIIPAAQQIGHHGHAFPALPKSPPATITTTTMGTTQGGAALAVLLATKLLRMIRPRQVSKPHITKREEQLLEQFSTEEQKAIMSFFDDAAKVQERLSESIKEFLAENCEADNITAKCFRKRPSSEKGLPKWYCDGVEICDAPHSQTGHLRALVKIASSTDCDIMLLDSNHKTLASLIRKINSKRGNATITLDWLKENIKDAARICFLGPPELLKRWHDFLVEKGFLLNITEEWCLNAAGFPCAKEVTTDQQTGIQFETMFEPKMSPLALKCLCASHICYEITRLNLTNENINDKQKSELLRNYNVIANIIVELIEQNLVTPAVKKELKLDQVKPIVQSESIPEPLKFLSENLSKILDNVKNLRDLFNGISVEIIQETSRAWDSVFGQETKQRGR